MDYYPDGYWKLTAFEKAMFDLEYKKKHRMLDKSLNILHFKNKIMIPKKIEKYPHHYKTHGYVHSAITHKIILKPDKCSMCKKIGYIQAHHDNYFHPLAIRWLCSDCHGGEHARLRFINQDPSTLYEKGIVELLSSHGCLIHSDLLHNQDYEQFAIFLESLKWDCTCESSQTPQ